MIFHTKYIPFQTKTASTMSNDISRYKKAIRFATENHPTIN